MSKFIQKDQDTSFSKKDQVTLQRKKKNLLLKKPFLKNLFGLCQRIKLHPSGETHVNRKTCVKQQTTSMVLPLAADKEMRGVSTGRASFDEEVLTGSGRIKLLAFRVLFIK